jgi:2-polyprenyl-6-methoxyphenol hydroxylase-like FAD-dependent oxidoreductase
MQKQELAPSWTEGHARTVLVVGAGPVGLTAACELVRQGARVRLIDARTRRLHAQVGVPTAARR